MNEVEAALQKLTQPKNQQIPVIFCLRQLSKFLCNQNKYLQMRMNQTIIQKHTFLNPGTTRHRIKDIFTYITVFKIQCNFFRESKLKT